MEAIILTLCDMCIELGHLKRRVSRYSHGLRHCQGQSPMISAQLSELPSPSWRFWLGSKVFVNIPLRGMFGGGHWMSPSPCMNPRQLSIGKQPCAHCCSVSVPEKDTHNFRGPLENSMELLSLLKFCHISPSKREALGVLSREG